MIIIIIIIITIIIIVKITIIIIVIIIIIIIIIILSNVKTECNHQTSRLKIFCIFSIWPTYKTNKTKYKIGYENLIFNLQIQMNNFDSKIHKQWLISC